MLSGVPLTGKTTFARALVETLDTRALHVENDRLRSLIVEAMDREEPCFDGEENDATYEAARRLIERGLEEGLHVVHDATNLRTSDRKRSYAVADELEAAVRVVFLDTPRDVLERRAREEGPAARRALEALGDRETQPSETTRPHVVLDGSREPQANVEAVREDEAFGVLEA